MYNNFLPYLLTECAPSFEEMSLALQQTIEADSNTDLLSEDDTILTPQQQLLMTWCWINIKVQAGLKSK